MSQGYYTQPTLSGDHLVFVCEDDLWHVPLSGGRARRLTNSRSEIRSPALSPDGKWLACRAMEEGDPDVYLMESEGGPMSRLTWLSTVTDIIGWSSDAQNIIFRSSHQAVHHLGSDAWLYRVPVNGGPVRRLPYGPAVSVHHQLNGSGVVLARNTIHNSRWKRYRGGMVGEVWVDENGKGEFKRILEDLNGNPVCPQWIDERIWFVSDHEGPGNLYSCNTCGDEIRPESHQNEYYVRTPVSDGSRIVYHAAGDLWRLDPHKQKAREQKIAIRWHSTKSRIQRRFFYGDSYLEDLAIHPEGHELSLTARGKLYSMPHWEHVVRQHGVRHGVRYRLPRWICDGRITVVSDSPRTPKVKPRNRHPREERLDVFTRDPSEHPEQSFALPPGRVQEMTVSPRFPHLALTTSRMELHVLNLFSGRTRRLDSSKIREINDPVFSPDGCWLAYTKHLTQELTAIFLLHLNPDREGRRLLPKKPVQITQPVRYDYAPNFDPEGRWLYFLSARVYNPIWDTVQTATSFSRSIKPYLVTLQAGHCSPFLPQPHPPGGGEQPHSAAGEIGKPSGNARKNSTDSAEAKTESKEPSKKPARLEIDLEGIQERITEFPVPEGLYGQVLGMHNKVMFTEFPLVGGIDYYYEERNKDKDEGVLWVYDFEKQEREILAQEVGSLQVTPSTKTMVYLSGNQVRVLEAGVPVPEEAENENEPSRKSGWIDLSRVRIAVNYPDEWSQMFREAWRLQKEFFWNEELSGVDWDQVYRRYARLLQKICSRSELSDLIWEMQGELGTSHAYEYGGDYPHSPRYPVGRLGADIEYDSARKCWVLRRIYRGDVWRKDEHSPLVEPGIMIEENDQLLAVGGIPVNEHTSPGELLVHQAGQTALLTVRSPRKRDGHRQVMVKTLVNERETRYREWVNDNTRFIEEETENRVGYLHIPDMDTEGIAEFHRGYLAQVDREGLIIDVRYNAGGYVSPLILEKLAHRHLGYDVPRWGSPESYPYHTLRGHLLVITNQFTGSDGDMFSASFKQLQLGKVIGKRTWGGVVGIDERYQLVDGTTTTQPQFSIWFHHAGWSVENYGVDPDILVEDSPQSYARGKDTQLESALETMLQLLKEQPVPPVSREISIHHSRQDK